MFLQLNNLLLLSKTTNANSKCIELSENVQDNPMKNCISMLNKKSIEKDVDFWIEWTNKFNLRTKSDCKLE